MPTPKLDKLCIEFVKRIPDQLEPQDPPFTPGSGPLPRSFLLSADVIIDYVNRALQRLFNTHWTALNGNIQAFINLFPELQVISEEEDLVSGEFVIADPYLDFFKIIGAFTNEDVYIKPKDESLYTHFKAAKYRSYQATDTDPAVIVVQDKMAVFPPDVATKFTFHYIKYPLDPETGQVFIQDGDYDIPYTEQWHKAIVDVAYAMYLEETVQTTQ
jgi:hypothetical protein